MDMSAHIFSLGGIGSINPGSVSASLRSLSSTGAQVARKFTQQVRELQIEVWAVTHLTYVHKLDI